MLPKAEAEAKTEAEAEVRKVRTVLRALVYRDEAPAVVVIHIAVVVIHIAHLPHSKAVPSIGPAIAQHQAESQEIAVA